MKKKKMLSAMLALTASLSLSMPASAAYNVGDIYDDVDYSEGGSEVSISHDIGGLPAADLLVNKEYPLMLSDDEDGTSYIVDVTPYMAVRRNSMFTVTNRAEPNSGQIVDILLFPHRYDGSAYSASNVFAYYLNTDGRFAYETAGGETPGKLWLRPGQSVQFTLPVDEFGENTVYELYGVSHSENDIYYGPKQQLKRWFCKIDEEAVDAALAKAGGSAAGTDAAASAGTGSEGYVWKSNSTGWWVERADGSYLAGQWYRSPESGLWYYMGADGYMLTDTTTPDGYYVNGDGVWAQ